MKKNIRYIAILIIISFLIWGGLNTGKNRKIYNEYKCETKNMEIKSIIRRVRGRSGYMVVNILNSRRNISLNTNKEIYREGHESFYSFDIGDSLIKKAGSKEFIIKNRKGMSIYILDCDD